MSPFYQGRLALAAGRERLGKLHNLPRVADFYMSLNLPFPGQTALAISTVEFFGGIFLALGILSRTTALVLTVNMLMAYVTTDREALLSIFANPDKFYAAAPYTFLVASVIILLFGPGKIALDGNLRWLVFFLSSRRLLQCR
jgi:putative oxidoreductase